MILLFYNTKRDNYQSDYSLMLMRISHQIIVIIESNQEWFEGKENEIGDLLSRASTIVYQLDTLEDKESKKVVEQIKVFVFKFKLAIKDVYI